MVVSKTNCKYNSVYLQKLGLIYNGDSSSANKHVSKDTYVHFIDSQAQEIKHFHTDLWRSTESLTSADVCVKKSRTFVWGALSTEFCSGFLVLSIDLLEYQTFQYFEISQYGSILISALGVLLFTIKYI